MTNDFGNAVPFLPFPFSDRGVITRNQDSGPRATLEHLFKLGAAKGIIPEAEGFELY